MKKVARLDQRPLLKFAALVDPAAVLGANLIAVPEAGVCLQHQRWIRFQDHPFGFLFRIVQSGTRKLGAEDSYTVSMLFHGPNEILHPLAQV